MGWALCRVLRDKVRAPKTPPLGAYGRDGGREDAAVRTQHARSPGILFTHLGKLEGSQVLVHLS